MNDARSILIVFNHPPCDGPIASTLAELADWVASSGRVRTF